MSLEMLKQFPLILKYEVATVYVRQKIYKFGRNQLSSFEDTEGRIWQLYSTK